MHISSVMGDRKGGWGWSTLTVFKILFLFVGFNLFLVSVFWCPLQSKCIKKKNDFLRFFSSKWRSFRLQFLTTVQFVSIFSGLESLIPHFFVLKVCFFHLKKLCSCLKVIFYLKSVPLLFRIENSQLDLLTYRHCFIQSAINGDYGYFYFL